MQDDLYWLLMAQRIPKLGAVHASAVLTFPKNRRRDEGNFRAPLEKALGDALQMGGWIADDTPDLFRFGALDFTHGGPHQTDITLWPMTPGQSSTPPSGTTTS